MATILVRLSITILFLAVSEGVQKMRLMAVEVSEEHVDSYYARTFLIRLALIVSTFCVHYSKVICSGKIFSYLSPSDCSGADLWLYPVVSAGGYLGAPKRARAASAAHACGSQPLCVELAAAAGPVQKPAGAIGYPS